MGPELRQLRYFLAVADELSFTRAAARLHLSQQALSLAIKQLEQRVGVTLLVRRPTALELTAAGETLLKHARPIVAAADALVVDIGAHRAGERGRLAVGLLMDGAGPLTAPILAAFREARPQVELSVRVLDPSQGLAPIFEGAVDVAVLHGPYEPDERVALEHLFLEPRVAAVPAASDLADAAAVAAADLLERPAGARHAAMPVGWEGFFTLVPERNGEQPERSPAPPAESFEEVLWNIGLRDLVLTLPAHYAGTFPAERFGIRYLPAPGLQPVTFALARRRAAVDPLVDAFAAIARRVTAELIGLIAGAQLPPQRSTA